MSPVVIDTVCLRLEMGHLAYKSYAERGESPVLAPP